MSNYISIDGLRLRYAENAIEDLRNGDSAAAAANFRLAGGEASKLAVAGLASEAPERASADELLDAMKEELKETPLLRAATTDRPDSGRLLFRHGRPGALPVQDWQRTGELLLQWIELQYPHGIFELDLSYVPAYGLVGIAACCRREADNPATFGLSSRSPSARFAAALGIHEVVDTGRRFVATEQTRTVPLTRIETREQVTKIAAKIASLQFPTKDYPHLREVVEYSLIELMRNVVQHSSDPLGGIALAQITSPEHGPGGLESIQISVADLGLGIEATLKQYHPDVEGEPIAAIQKAMRPYVSGAFAEGKTGGMENAGLGLFFLTQIAKLLRGRLLIAIKGGAICMERVDADGHAVLSQLAGTGFPGTLVVLEIPRVLPEKFQSGTSVVQYIRDHEIAKYSSIKKGSTYWINYSEPDADLVTRTIAVGVGARDFKSIRGLVEAVIMPAIRDRTAIVLDFINVSFLTDSMAHELVGEAIREAFIHKVPVHATNTTTAIVNILDFVQGYRLADLGKKKRRRGPKARYLKPPDA